MSAREYLADHVDDVEAMLQFLPEEDRDDVRAVSRPHLALRELDSYLAALRQIAETSRWYANNGQRDQHEVDHALCVEIVSLAERALEDQSVTR